MDTIPVFAVNIPPQMAAAFNNKAFFPPFMCLMRKYSTKQSAAYY